MKNKTASFKISINIPVGITQHYSLTELLAKMTVNQIAGCNDSVQY